FVFILRGGAWPPKSDLDRIWIRFGCAIGVRIIPTRPAGQQIADGIVRRLSHSVIYRRPLWIAFNNPDWIISSFCVGLVRSTVSEVHRVTTAIVTRWLFFKESFISLRRRPETMKKDRIDMISQDFMD